jgi:hypothetical protein
VLLVVAGLAVPALGLWEARAPAFLVPVAALWYLGRAGAARTSTESLRHKVFDRCRELAVWLMPGLLLWSIIWGRLSEGALSFDGAMRLGAMEAHLHELDSLFKWIERVRAGELIVAGVVVLLAILRTPHRLSQRLVGGAKASFPWLKRVSYLWIGLTAFTLLGPAPAALSLVKEARVEISKRRDELEAGAHLLAKEVTRTTLRDVIKTTAARTELHLPLAALDAGAEDVADCARLKALVDRNGGGHCPMPHNWAAWRKESAGAVAALERQHEATHGLALKALDSLSYDEVRKGVQAYGGGTREEPSAGEAGVPSEEVEYVTEQAVEALYEHAPKKAVEAAIPLLDGVSELGLITPFLDALVHDSVKDAISRTLARVVGRRIGTPRELAEAVSTSIAPTVPPLGPDVVRAAGAVAGELGPAPAVQDYVASLWKKDAARRAQEAAKTAKRELARVAMRVLGQELHDGSVFIRGDLGAVLSHWAREYVPGKHLLAPNSKPPKDAIVIEAKQVDRKQLVAAIRRRAPETFRAHVALAESIRDADFGDVVMSLVVDDPNYVNQLMAEAGDHFFDSRSPGDSRPRGATPRTGTSGGSPQTGTPGRPFVGPDYYGPHSLGDPFVVRLPEGRPIEFVPHFVP